MHKLGINIDHIATLRQARLGKYPDPVFGAMIAEQAGVQNITLHIREDRRHTQERDLAVLKETVNIKINLEMAPTEELKEIALKYLPTSVTLVPEKREELTTEGGLDLLADSNSFLKTYVAELKEAGIEVSLFIDPIEEQIEKSIELNVDAVEFNTGKYSESNNKNEENLELEKIAKAIDFALQNNLKAHVGHGLNYNNVQKLAMLGTIEEFNIGHSIVSRALFVGFEKAVKDMMKILGIL